MKTKIYNLIILDESGSMGWLAKPTISGCNETINTIKSAQRRYADTQDHYVSIYAFQSDGDLPSRYIIKNVPAATVKRINRDHYQPYGCTPLYDAVGSTLVDLRATVKAEEGVAIGSVTIITDGYENSSKMYKHDEVALMISQLKELGWNFNFIGANIDVRSTAQSLNIDNSMSFEQTVEGTQNMFHREHDSRMRYYERSSRVMECDSDVMPTADRKAQILAGLKDASEGYFDENDENDRDK